MKCPLCGQEGVVKQHHESTGKIIFWNTQSESPHRCKPKTMTKYWCVECNASIPLRNPCIHKRKKKGLEMFV